MKIRDGLGFKPWFETFVFGVVVIILLAFGIKHVNAAEQRIPNGIVDACELRGWIAFDVVKKKNAGMTLKEVKADFYKWLTEAPRMPELAPGPSNLVISWYNDWGPEDIQDWFKRTYVHSEPVVAYNNEVTACKVSEDPPEYKIDRKL
jgi:hypothetical protein